MNWWGKIIGGALGFAMGGPLGAAIGAAFGHSFDKGLKVSLNSHEQSQTVFFTAVFTLMGYIAKADGTVSSKEIRSAEHIFDQMQLTEQQRQTAIRLFNIGKNHSEQDFAQILGQIRQYIRHQQAKLTLLQIVIYIAANDGGIGSQERSIIQAIVTALGISNHDYQAIYQNVQGSLGLSGQSLDQAYAILGLPESATKAEIKKRYRVLMAKNHPDKLSSQGVPEEMITLANKKSAEISRAYDQIMKAL